MMHSVETYWCYSFGFPSQNKDVAAQVDPGTLETR